MGSEWVKVSSAMPEETEYKYVSSNVCSIWSESEKVFVWDSLYGPSVDFTKNGKWASELKSSCGGQIRHEIVAWMPIEKPEFIEE